MSAEAPPLEEPVCQSCGRRRRPDEPDYDVFQLLTPGPLGWFNEPGEQVCGDCLAAMMKGQTP